MREYRVELCIGCTRRVSYATMRYLKCLERSGFLPLRDRKVSK